MRAVKLWSDILSTWVTIVGAFLGGGFAIWQYHDKVVSDRVGAALQFVDRYNNPPVQDARVRIATHWDKHAAEMFRKAELGEAALAPFLVRLVERGKLQEDVGVLSDFYENIHVCTCAKLCDEETVLRFFGKRAYDFWGSHAPYVQKQRTVLKDASFGYGVESIAMSHVRAQSLREHYCAGKRPAVPAP